MNTDTKSNSNYLLKNNNFSSEAATRAVPKKGVPRNFTKFTGKQLCQGLFFNEVAGPNFLKFLRTLLDNCFFFNLRITNFASPDTIKHP